MTGIEAFCKLRDWKTIRRECWSESEYVEVKDMGDGTGELEIHKDLVTANDHFHHRANRFADLLRDLLLHDDWEVVE